MVNAVNCWEGKNIKKQELELGVGMGNLLINASIMIHR